MLSKSELEIFLLWLQVSDMLKNIALTRIVTSSSLTGVNVSARSPLKNVPVYFVYRSAEIRIKKLMFSEILCISLVWD